MHLLDINIILLIIAVPLFFLFKWILRFFIEKQKTRHIITLVGTFIITPIIYLGLVHAFMFYITYEPKWNFERNKWFDEKHERWKMVHDLIDKKILLAKDTNWIKSYIGEPTSKHNFTQWEYSLGSGGGGLGFKLHFLSLKINNGRIDSTFYYSYVD